MMLKMIANGDIKKMVEPWRVTNMSALPTSVTNIFDVVKTSLMMNLKTGNVAIDMCLQTIIISFIGYLTMNLSIWVGRVKEALTKKMISATQVTIETTGTYCTTDYGERVQQNSLFKAVVYAINTFLTDDHSNMEITAINDDDRNGGPPCGVVIKLTPDVNCIFSSTTVDGQTNTGSPPSPIKINKITCKIYSTTLTIQQLKKFTDKLKADHQTYLAEIEERNKALNIKHMYLYKRPGTSFQKHLLETMRCFDNIFFEQKEELMNHIQFFMNNIEWYQRTGSPHTLGICLSGPPGTGKTSCIKSIAKYTKRNIVMVSLRDLKSYEDLLAVFSGHGYRQHDAPTTKQDIFVIEDIDCVGSDIVKSRDGPNASNVQHASYADPSHPTLTLSDILNAIDGILEFNGRILIITTNHLETLDRALIRPGRIDINIVMDRASISIMKQVISHFFNLTDEHWKGISLDKRLDKWLTPAELTCLCKQFVRRTHLELIDHLHRMISGGRK